MTACSSISALLLPSCVVSHSRSTIADEKTAYAVSAEEARDIVNSSLQGFISPDYFTGTSSDGLTKTGYYRMMLDTTTITGSAVPATGTDMNGATRSGYGFTVTDVGTIIGLDMPAQIYEAMKVRASQTGPVLKTR